jgi:hypothetical protein
MRITTQQKVCICRGAARRDGTKDTRIHGSTQKCPIYRNTPPPPPAPSVHSAEESTKKHPPPMPWFSHGRLGPAAAAMAARGRAPAIWVGVHIRASGSIFEKFQPLPPVAHRGPLAATGVARVGGDIDLSSPPEAAAIPITL